MDQDLSRTLLAIRRRHPFFSALSMFAEYRFEQRGESPVATDGRRIYIDPHAFRSWAHEDRCYAVLHVVLHAALLHTVRRGPREVDLWNLATDIVVDNAIEETQCFQPSFETAADERFAELNAEQVYARLRGGECNDEAKSPREGRHGTLSGDLLDSGESHSVLEPVEGLHAGERLEAELRRHWTRALERARMTERLRDQHRGGRGTIPHWLNRQIDALSTPTLDWRTMLWRFLVRTPCDYIGFDRRFLWQGLYLDALGGESLRVHVALDTSGSISDDDLRRFLSEVDGLIHSYPHIECWLSCIDAALHGPHKVEDSLLSMPIVGGGGTDFQPFFEAIAEDEDPTETLCVFLTDGFGEFPEDAPRLPVLWVVPTDGLDAGEFPFGEVTYLSDDDGGLSEAAL